VFNKTMGKPNNYTPNIPEEKEWMFVYNFILEELEEYKEACQKGDIVGVLDALCDITYVSLGNGTMLHGLKGQIKDAYAEVQASNMSKVCKTEEEAQQTVNRRTIEQGMECHYEKQGDYWVVYRTSDRKVMKSINYFKPNLEQFFKLCTNQSITILVLTPIIYETISKAGWNSNTSLLIGNVQMSGLRMLDLF
jgi:hypothetical protein